LGSAARTPGADSDSLTTLCRSPSVMRWSPTTAAVPGRELPQADSSSAAVAQSAAAAAIRRRRGR